MNLSAVKCDLGAGGVCAAAAFLSNSETRCVQPATPGKGKPSSLISVSWFINNSGSLLLLEIVFILFYIFICIYNSYNKSNFKACLEK